MEQRPRARCGGGGGGGGAGIVTCLVVMRRTTTSNSLPALTEAGNSTVINPAKLPPDPVGIGI